jgi:hypothetical protein
LQLSLSCSWVPVCTLSAKSLKGTNTKIKPLYTSLSGTLSTLKATFKWKEIPVVSVFLLLFHNFCQIKRILWRAYGCHLLTKQNTKTVWA